MKITVEWTADSALDAISEYLDLGGLEWANDEGQAIASRALAREALIALHILTEPLQGDEPPVLRIADEL